MTWATQTPAERTAAARQLLEVDKLSFGAAAERLGTTKNSLISFAKRHGLKSSHASGYPPETRRAIGLLFQPKTKQPKPKRERKHSQHQAVAVVQRKDPQPGALPPDPIWLPLPGSTPIAVEHHLDGTCKWPVGQHGAHLFCALPVPAAGKNYCQAHHDAGTRIPERMTK